MELIALLSKDEETWKQVSGLMNHGEWEKVIILGDDSARKFSHKNKFEFIMTSISADGLDKSWLNKIITKKDVEKLKELNQKYGVSIIGEGGCFESFVLNCPIFNKKISILDSEIKMESEKS